MIYLVCCPDGIFNDWLRYGRKNEVFIYRLDNYRFSIARGSDVPRIKTNDEFNSYDIADTYAIAGARQMENKLNKKS